MRNTHYSNVDHTSTETIDRLKSFQVARADFTEIIVIVSGFDSLPVIIPLKKIDYINIYFLKGKEVACISWKDGGSQCIGIQYYTLLKKYWFAECNIDISLDILESEEEFTTELMKMEGYKELFDAWVEVAEKKDVVVKEQQYAEAAKIRNESEKPLLEQLIPFIVKGIENLAEILREREFAKII